MSLIRCIWRSFICLPVTPAPNPKLTLAIEYCRADSGSGISFLIKQILLAKAVRPRSKLSRSRVAYIVSFALCEVSGLLALLDYRLTGSNYYYVGFAIGGIGLLLHFPRKQHLLDASSRRIEI